MVYGRLQRDSTSRLNPPQRPPLAGIALLCLGLAPFLSCLSLNDQFGIPISETTDATSPVDNTRTQTESSSSDDTRNGGNAETTMDDPPLNSTGEPSSGAASTPSETLTSSSTSSISSSSSTSASTSASSDSSTETAVERCNNPTLCYETNPGASVNRFVMAPFDSYAIPVPTAAGPLNVARVDVYTGSLLGTHTIGLHPNEPSDSEEGVQKAHFSSTVFQRWYAASFDLPIQVSERTPYWISWSPPAGSLGSAAFGKQIEGTQKHIESSPWRPNSYPLKMRVYCCP